MKLLWPRLLQLAALLLVPALLTGCEGDSGSASPSGLNISGHWSGEYISPDDSESVSAEISQDGTSVVIATSKPSGTGRLLVGILTADDRLELVDEHDGQTWTSQGDVTASHIRIRDFLLGSGAFEGAPPEQDIVLDR